MQIYSKLNKFNAFYLLQLYLLGFLWWSEEGRLDRGNRGSWGNDLGHIGINYN